jgi:hypothetical protein
MRLASTISSCPAATRFLCRLAIGIIGGRDLGESAEISARVERRQVRCKNQRVNQERRYHGLSSVKLPREPTGASSKAHLF